MHDLHAEQSRLTRMLSHSLLFVRAGPTRAVIFGRDRLCALQPATCCVLRNSEHKHSMLVVTPDGNSCRICCASETGNTHTRGTVLCGHVCVAGVGSVLRGLDAPVSCCGCYLCTWRVAAAVCLAGKGDPAAV